LPKCNNTKDKMLALTPVKPVHVDARAWRRLP
jgi:hypothetical protein